MAAAFALILLSAGAFALPERGPAHAPYALRIALPAASADPAIVADPGLRAARVEVLAEAPAVVEPEAAPSPPVLADAAQVRAAVAVPARARMTGVIPLNYSLAGGARAGDAIELDKPVSFAGNDAGRIMLRIDGNAKVYALGSKLAEIIARQSGEAAVPAGLERDFVSLDRLRALGLGVRYDAIRDRLVVDPPGV